MEDTAKKIASLYAERMGEDDHFAGRDWGINNVQGQYNAKPGYKQEYGSKTKEFLKDLGKDEISWTERDRKNYRMFWGAKHSNPPRYIKYKNMSNPWVEDYCKRSGRTNGICGGKTKKKAYSVLPADTLSPDVALLLNRELARTCTHLRCSKGEVLNAINSVLSPFGLRVISTRNPHVFNVGAMCNEGCMLLKGAELILKNSAEGWGARVE